MTEGFASPIIGGGGGLVYPSIHSPDYSAGPPLTGWSINKDGSASFADLELASPTLILPSGFTGTIPITQSDSSTNTVTGTGLTALSKAWDVPANDAAANVIYRLTVWGNGSQGSTAHNLSWAVHFGSVAIISLSVNATAWTASVGANWRLQLELQCTAAGGSGNMNADGIFLLSNNSTSAAIYAAALVDNINTIDTTIDNKIQLLAQWNATTTGPTISSYGSIFERIS